MTIKEFIIELFFPRFCLFCKKEGSWLCEDCQAILDLPSQVFCPFHSYPKPVLDFKICKSCRKKTSLTGLIIPFSYQNPRIKKLIEIYKYPPFLKELSLPLAQLIKSYFSLIEFFSTTSAQKPGDFVLVPVPLHQKRERWRGFNQAKEITLHLSQFWQIPMIEVLIRKKETLPQIELEEEERKENLKDAFEILDFEPISQKKIFLIDDVFTSGATLEESAKVLKKAKPKEIWGICLARS